MYICKTCGTVFSKPGKRIDRAMEESSGMFPYRCVFDVYRTCPNEKCGSTEIEETIHCRGSACDAVIGETQSKYNLCEQCTASVKPRFIKLLRENFTPGEIKLLNDLYEGEYFTI